MSDSSRRCQGLPVRPFVKIMNPPSPSEIENAAAALTAVAQLLREHRLTEAAAQWRALLRMQPFRFTAEKPEDLEEALLATMGPGERAAFLQVYSLTCQRASEEGAASEDARREGARTAADLAGTPSISPAACAAALFRQEWSWSYVMTPAALAASERLMARYPSLSRAEIIEKLLIEAVGREAPAE